MEQNIRSLLNVDRTAELADGKNIKSSIFGFDKADVFEKMNEIQGFYKSCIEQCANMIDEKENLAAALQVNLTESENKLQEALNVIQNLREESDHIAKQSQQKESQLSAANSALAQEKLQRGKLQETLERLKTEAKQLIEQTHQEAKLQLQQFQLQEQLKLEEMRESERKAIEAVRQEEQAKLEQFKAQEQARTEQLEALKNTEERKRVALEKQLEAAVMEKRLLQVEIEKVIQGISTIEDCVKNIDLQLNDGMED